MAWITPRTDWTPADGVSDSDMKRIEGNTLHLKPKTVTATLTTSWSGTAAPFTQNVSVSGLTATTGVVVVSIAPTATVAQYTAAADAQLHPKTQGAGTLTISAMSEKPTVSIPIVVFFMD